MIILHDVKDDPAGFHVLHEDGFTCKRGFPDADAALLWAAEYERHVKMIEKLPEHERAAAIVAARAALGFKAKE